jgi:uncharacterized membrane protein YkgB
MQKLQQKLSGLMKRFAFPRVNKGVEGTMDIDRQFSLQQQNLTNVATPAESATSMEIVGAHVSRYGLVLTLLLIGILKFNASEAQGIQPLVANSPLMSWLYRVYSVQGVSNLIGAIEIVVALLMALRPFSARLAFLGSVGAIITFVLTVSFLFSTPGAFQFSHGIPLLGDAGQFLIKDLVLLGSSVWTAAEARKAF